MYYSNLGGHYLNLYINFYIWPKIEEGRAVLYTLYTFAKICTTL